MQSRLVSGIPCCTCTSHSGWLRALWPADRNRRPETGDAMSVLKTVVLVANYPNDVELTLEALAEYRPANEVVVIKDGDVGLDYLYRRGRFATRVRRGRFVGPQDAQDGRLDGRAHGQGRPPDLKTIPIVMLPSLEERDLVLSYALGVNAYVIKPVDFGQFVDAVKQVVYFWGVLNEAPPPLRRQE